MTCKQLIDTKLYSVCYGNDMLWKAGARAFYDTVLLNMDEIVHGKSQLRMQIDSSHDYDIDLKIEALGFPIRTNVEFST
jgi:hypothetical protein